MERHKLEKLDHDLYARLGFIFYLGVDFRLMAHMQSKFLGIPSLRGTAYLFETDLNKLITNA